MQETWVQSLSWQDPLGEDLSQYSKECYSPGGCRELDITVHSSIYIGWHHQLDGHEFE